MKNLIVKFLSIALIVFPMMLSAQNSSIEDLYEEYVGEDGFTSVNISKDMFMLLAQLDGSFGDEEFNEMQEAMAGLNGMKILSYDRSGDETGKKLKLKINEILKEGEFVELMTVKESDSDARFMLRKDGEDIIELLLVHTEGSQTSLISFFGIIDLKTISKLSKSVQFKGMKSFEKINEKYN